jgi:hypothetical protein
MDTNKMEENKFIFLGYPYYRIIEAEFLSNYKVYNNAERSVSSRKKR